MRTSDSAPIGTATPNAIYTQQAAKLACQEDINTQKQRQSGGAQNASKRTSDPVFLLECHLAQVAWSLSVLSLSLCTTSRLAPWTRGESNRGLGPKTPKRTSDPVQVLQVPRLPRKSSSRAAPTTRQSVHQTPCKCSKFHACHAKAAAERQSPKRQKSFFFPQPLWLKPFGSRRFGSSSVSTHHCS